jgi:hypothetical protein
LSRFHLHSKFTAEYQNEFEGQTVVFRSGLLDVVRRATDNYDLIFGDPLGLDGSLVVLRSNEAATELLEAAQRNALHRYLVAAQIDKIAPLNLKLKSCTESDCDEIGLETRMLGRSYSIVGTLLGIETKQ